MSLFWKILLGIFVLFVVLTAIITPQVEEKPKPTVTEKQQKQVNSLSTNDSIQEEYEEETSEEESDEISEEPSLEDYFELEDVQFIRKYMSVEYTGKLTNITDKELDVALYIKYYDNEGNYVFQDIVFGDILPGETWKFESVSFHDEATSCKLLNVKLRKILC